MKRYMTWKIVKMNEFKYISQDINNKYGDITKNAIFSDLFYQIADGRIIGFVEYPNDTIQEIIDGTIIELTPFEFTFITEAEANTLLAELGEVSVSNFIFTDNRPVDII